MITIISCFMTAILTFIAFLILNNYNLWRNNNIKTAGVIRAIRNSIKIYTDRLQFHYDAAIKNDLNDDESLNKFFTPDSLKFPYSIFDKLNLQLTDFEIFGFSILKNVSSQNILQQTILAFLADIEYIKDKNIIIPNMLDHMNKVIMTNNGLVSMLDCHLIALEDTSLKQYLMLTKYFKYFPLFKEDKKQKGKLQKSIEEMKSLLKVYPFNKDFKNNLD